MAPELSIGFVGFGEAAWKRCSPHSTASRNDLVALSINNGELMDTA